MNAHNKMMLKKIQEFCKEYIVGKIDFAGLQSSVDAIRTNLESDMDRKLTDKIFYFIEELESIRFMNDDNEHLKLVSEKINKLNLLIDAAIDDRK